MDSSELRYRLRRSVSDWDDEFDESDVQNGGFSHGDFQLVGHGSVTNGYCGKFKAFYGCPRTELHNKAAFDKHSVLVDYAGKAYVRKVMNSCDKPSCPVCYKYGWAVREAGKIESRLHHAHKLFGQVEHIVATVPPKFYGLSYEALRAKILEILRVRRVIGGALIFHGFRLDKKKWWWYWSPHFHVLGFILGGYNCRDCKKTCFRGCGEWEDWKYRCYEQDGCIVRVLDERKTVGGTAWYQLNHASHRVDTVRFHVATWFGVCSYRKLKVSAEYKKNVCPICQHDLVRLMYSGWKSFILDREASGFRRDSFEDAFENGCKVWVEHPAECTRR